MLFLIKLTVVNIPKILFVEKKLKIANYLNCLDYIHDLLYLHKSCLFHVWTQLRCTLCLPWFWKWIFPMFPSILQTWCTSCHRPLWWIGNFLARKSFWLLRNISVLFTCKDQKYKFCIDVVSHMSIIFLKTRWTEMKGSIRCLLVGWAGKLAGCLM